MSFTWFSSTHRYIYIAYINPDELKKEFQENSLYCIMLILKNGLSTYYGMKEYIVSVDTSFDDISYCVQDIVLHTHVLLCTFIC